ncbi:glycosyltransferase family 2 protein [Chloroflexota bacterium]
MKYDGAKGRTAKLVQQNTNSEMGAETGPKIIVCIPCYNTESTITDVVSRARKYVDDVLVVNDGSQDDTAEVAKRAGARIVNHNVQGGYGESIKSCFESARLSGADILVILDGDGQHNPDEIPRLLTQILKGEADLTIGSRFLNNKMEIPRYRRFGISVITLLFNIGSKVQVSDAQSGFRAYARNAFEDLRLSESGMNISIEILEKVRHRGATITEVPISCLYTSSMITWKAIEHGLGVALSVTWIRFKSALGRIA